MKRIEVFFGVLKVPLHALGAIAALLLSYKLREANIDLIPTVQLLPPANTLPPFSDYIVFAASASLLYIVLSALFGLYSLKITLGPWREVGRILIVSAIWLLLIVSWYVFVEKELFFSRFVLIQSTALLTFFVLIVHTLTLLIQRALLRRGIGVRIVMSLGGQDIPAHLHAILMKDPRYRYAGHIASLQELLHRRKFVHIDLILHTDPRPKHDETAELIDYCRSHHLAYTFLPPVFSDVPQHLTIARLGMVPILSFQPTPLDGWGRVLKRLGDFIIAIVLLILLSPILLLIALLIVLTSGLPIFYVSTRIGQYGKETIPMLKFRTMRPDADALKETLSHLSHRTDGPLFKIKNDPRITPLGQLLRRWTLDELPQLFNVLLGHMSLVGPRPHLPDEVGRYSDYQRRLFTVKPGMTGIAQVSGRSNLKFEEEVQLDMRYIEEWSPLLDLWIMWRTIFVVLFGRGAD